MLATKRKEIDRTSLDIASSIDADITAGLLDLTATEEKLVRGMTPEEKEDYTTLPAEARAQAVRYHLIK